MRRLRSPLRSTTTRTSRSLAGVGLANSIATYPPPGRSRWNRRSAERRSCALPSLPIICCCTSGYLGYVRGLRALLALNDLEFYTIAFGERLEPIAGNGAVVDEDVRPPFTRDEAEPLRVVEPFDSARDARHRSYPSS